MARWFAMSTQFLTDPKVERMVDQHGNDAIAVAVALFSQAMLQERGGTVERTYRTLAKESNTDRDTAFAVVQTGAEVGFLKLVDGDEFEFQVAFPAWARHQGNFRKARSRAKKAHEQADVTDGHAMSRNGHDESRDASSESRLVTKCPPQDKTREEKKQPVDEQKLADRSGDVDQIFDAWVEATGKRKGATKLTDERRRLIRKALKTYPVEDLIDAVRGWRHSAHHRGENDRRTVYNDIELLLRAAKQIEFFRDLERGASTATDSWSDFLAVES